jgi:hypothetical protein
LRLRRIRTKHATLAHPLAHLSDRHAPPTRHRLGETGVVVIHARLHEALSLFVERRIRVPSTLYLPAEISVGWMPSAANACE